MANSTWGKNSSLGASGKESSLNEPILSEVSLQVFLFSLVTWSLTVLVGVVCNTVLCVTICASPSLRTAMNTYVLGIGLVDLLTCLMLLPARLAVEKMARDGQDVPEALYSLELLVRTSTELVRLLLIQALSFERYQAIARPFSVSKATARKRAIVVSLSVAGFALVLSGLAIRFFCDSVNLSHCAATDSWGELELYIELPLTVTAILSIALSYSLILLVLQQQRRKMAQHNNQRKPKANQIAPLKPTGDNVSGYGKKERISSVLGTRSCVCCVLPLMAALCCVKRYAIGSAEQVAHKSLFEDEGGELPDSTANEIVDKAKPRLQAIESKTDKYELSNTTESEIVTESVKELHENRYKSINFSSKHDSSAKVSQMGEILNSLKSAENTTGNSIKSYKNTSDFDKFHVEIGVSTIKTVQTIPVHEESLTGSATGLGSVNNEPIMLNNTDKTKRNPTLLATSVLSSVSEYQTHFSNFSVEHMTYTTRGTSQYSNSEMETIDPIISDTRKVSSVVAIHENTNDSALCHDEEEFSSSKNIRSSIGDSCSSLPLHRLTKHSDTTSKEELEVKDAQKSLDSKCSLVIKTAEFTNDLAYRFIEKDGSNSKHIKIGERCPAKKVVDNRTVSAQRMPMTLSAKKDVNRCAQGKESENFKVFKETEQNTFGVTHTKLANRCSAVSSEEQRNSDTSVAQDNRRPADGLETLDTAIDPVCPGGKSTLLTAGAPGLGNAAETEKRAEINIDDKLTLPSARALRLDPSKTEVIPPDKSTRPVAEALRPDPAETEKRTEVSACHNSTLSFAEAHRRDPADETKKRPEISAGVKSILSSTNLHRPDPAAETEKRVEVGLVDKSTLPTAEAPRLGIAPETEKRLELSPGEKSTRSISEASVLDPAETEKRLEVRPSDKSTLPCSGAADPVKTEKRIEVNPLDNSTLPSSEAPGHGDGAETEKRVEVVEGDGTVHLEPVRKVTQGSNSAAPANIEGAVCLMNPKNKELGRRKVELRAALKVGLLFLSFLFLWTPLPVLVTVIRVTSAVPRKPFQADLLGIVSVLASSTAALDPILYGLLNRPIRTAMKQLLKKLKRKLSQSVCVR